MTPSVSEVSQRLMAEILKRAYELDARNLDAAAHALAERGWAELTQGVAFEEAATGGGLAIMMCELPVLGHFLCMTDGEADLPDCMDRFHLEIVKAPGDYELYFMLVVDGRVDQRGGRLVEEGRLPLSLTP